MPKNSDELLLTSLARKASTDGSGRTLREAQHLTLREVAEALQTSAASLSRWETGRNSPKGWRAVMYGSAIAAWLAVAEAERG
jgi:transcriptional regulator with XRE-family HTH domain